MQLKANTDAKAKVDLKNNIEVQPTNFKLGPMGKVTLTLPQMKIRVPDVKLRLWFFPFIRIGGLNVDMDPGQLVVNLNETVVNGKLDSTNVQVGGEVSTHIEA